MADRTTEACASHAWYVLLRHIERHIQDMSESMKRENLSPVMAGFLDHLAKSPPGPMSELVTHMGVDAAWVTDVVDKLEARGDVVRSPSLADRRVKIIQITEAGKRTHRMFEDMMRKPPAALLKSPAADLRALDRIAQRLAATDAHQAKTERPGLTRRTRTAPGWKRRQA